MPYKITFTNKREPLIEWSDIEKQTILFKVRDVCDEIYVKPVGRNVYSKDFQPNVTYSVRDCLVQKKHRKKLDVIVICNHNGLIDDVVLRPKRGYKTDRNPMELIDAILRADREYYRVGGGILYRTPLHASPHFVEVLRDKFQILLF